MKRFQLMFSVFVVGSIAFYGCKKYSTSEDLSYPEKISINSIKADVGNSGAVYIQSNQASGNSVLVYRRLSNGVLVADGSYSTGGNGTGSGLGSQGSVILHEHAGNSYLYVANAGSHDVTVFRIDGATLSQVDKVSSHGIMPLSLTAHEAFFYVLNAGGTGNISGFHINDDGHLTYLENSTKSLSSDNAGPAQIQFNNAGTQLVVTEKNTNRISTYSVHENGLTSGVISNPAVGITPFGFGFDNHDQLIVTDAFNGVSGQSAVTSFNLSNTGNLSLIDGPEGTKQTSACWLAITNNGKYCYSTNTGSASITGYSVNNGALELLNASGVTATTGTTPIDVSLTNNSKFLYNVNSTSHSISMFRVNEDGSLDALGNLSGLPESAVGIAAK